MTSTLRLLVIAYAVASAPMIVSCGISATPADEPAVAANADSADEETRPLSERETEAAVVGRTILAPQGSHDKGDETFGVDGTYSKRGGHGIVSGRYVIQSNRVEVSFPTPRESLTRFFFRHQGQIVMSDEGGPSSDRMNWRPVVYPNPQP